MLKKKFAPITLVGLLFASPLVLAEEAHHPEEGEAATAQTAPAEAAKDTDSATLAAPGGMMMGGQGMMGGPGGGMMQGGKGGGMGMMRQGMMGGMPCQSSGQGGMMMGRGGGMGMMQGSKSGGMGMRHGGKGGGMTGMHEKHRKLIGRLDLLEARLVKIEAMLERLLLR